MAISEIELVPHKNWLARYLSGTWFTYKNADGESCILTDHTFIPTRFSDDRGEAFSSMVTTSDHQEALRIYYTDRWMFDDDSRENRLYMERCEAETDRSISDELFEFLREPSTRFRWLYLWVDIAFFAFFLYGFVFCLVVPRAQDGFLDFFADIMRNMYRRTPKNEEGD